MSELRTSDRSGVWGRRGLRLEHVARDKALESFQQANGLKPHLIKTFKVRSRHDQVFLGDNRWKAPLIVMKRCDEVATCWKESSRGLPV